MELRHLRYFVAVAESLHFGQAAAALRIAQPSLSHQIKQLEGELQTPLLRRTRRHVQLTDAGRHFLDDARDILARADRAAMQARRTGRGGGGRLRIGVGYCMDLARIAAAVSAFYGRHPAMSLEVQTMAVPAQLAALRSQTLDLGFVRPPISDPDLDSALLTRESLIVALPARHRLAHRALIPLAALAREPFVLVPRDLVPVYHDIVLKACREAGFVPHSPYEADHLLMVLEMVSGGSGVALVPAFARSVKPPRVTFASLRPPAATLEMSMAWRRDDPAPLLAGFVKIAAKVVPRRP